MTAPIDAMNPEETLALWQNEEVAVRARLQTVPGVASPAQVVGRSGLQILEALLSGELPPPPMAATLDFTPVSIEPGHAVFLGRPGSKYYNPMGTVHGGWYAAMLDTVMGCAVHSTLDAGKGYTTLELKLNLVRALTEAIPLVRAEGWLVHGGRQVATAEGRILGPDGKLYAHASTTCLIFDQGS
ncbi:PaaI family thioesterase [Halomonas huangheensis]|uniref:Thioesterase n=1 Tax=Halomonas huangheensis TaxID=1178482 RepID=W1N1K4_9GAMM|nr:PaaI family thioesterase [Halomonas huangheensis]ALM53034.1 aromatic compound catabolic protein [Halomonas huangheensis]ERL49369.1 thioesterase [Halomonas huangheensis]